MPTIRERAAAVFGRWAQNTGGWSVTYRDPGYTDKRATLTATPTKRDYEVFTGGMPSKVTRYDFMVTASEVVTSAGVRFEPLHGGLITVVRNGVTEKYEVLPPADNIPAVERMDASGTLLLLHTIKVD
jgi:hypothetical protein